MTIETQWLYAFLLVTVRCSAMMLSSPMFGGAVPARVRMFFCLFFAACVAPMAAETVGPVPADMGVLVMMIAHEALVGLIIGLCMQLLLLAAQMAGTIMDMQLGFQMMQMFNPQIGGAVTVLGQFKFMLFLVLIFLLDGHHMMLNAFVQSYSATISFTPDNLEALKQGFLAFLGGICVLALQIAAPVAAVSFIVDAAAGVINKSIPQVPVYMVTMGAKTAMGIMAIALGLPLMVVAVRSGLEHTEQRIADLLMIAAR